MNRPGGLKEEHVATQNEQQLADQFRERIENEKQTKFTQYKAEKFRTQVVAGTNYFISVNTGNNHFLHLRIYVDFQRTASLHSYRDGKTSESPLEYF